MANLLLLVTCPLTMALTLPEVKDVMFKWVNAYDFSQEHSLDLHNRWLFMKCVYAARAHHRQARDQRPEADRQRPKVGDVVVFPEVGCGWFSRF